MKRKRTAKSQLTLLPSVLTLIPSVLINPVYPSAKKIKTKYNATIQDIRGSIPHAYHQIKKLKYKLKNGGSLTMQDELTDYKDIILRARHQMRLIQTQKNQELSKMKTTNIFSYLTKRERKAAKEALYRKN